MLTWINVLFKFLIIQILWVDFNFILRYDDFRLNFLFCFFFTKNIVERSPWGLYIFLKSYILMITLFVKKNVVIQFIIIPEKIVVVFLIFYFFFHLFYNDLKNIFFYFNEYKYFLFFFYYLHQNIPMNCSFSSICNNTIRHFLFPIWNNIFANKINFTEWSGTNSVL